MKEVLRRHSRGDVRQLLRDYKSRWSHAIQITFCWRSVDKQALTIAMCNVGFYLVVLLELEVLLLLVPASLRHPFASKQYLVHV